MTVDEREGAETAGEIDQASGTSTNLEAAIAASGQEHPSRRNILDAITSRLQAEGDLSKVKDEERRQQERKSKILRAINDLTFSVKYAQASPCLKLIHTLVNNIVSHPSEPKYRCFKETQPKIAREVLSLTAGKTLLVEIGFRVRTKEFQREWFVPVEWKEDSPGMKMLQQSLQLLTAKINAYEDDEERKRITKEAERAFEANRKSRALDAAREDRERVALRAERERISRKAAEAQAKAEEEAEEDKTD